MQLVAIQDAATPAQERMPPRWTRSRDGTFEFGNVEGGMSELRYRYGGLSGAQQIEVRDSSEQSVVAALEAATNGR